MNEIINDIFINYKWDILLSITNFVLYLVTTFSTYTMCKKISKNKKILKKITFFDILIIEAYFIIVFSFLFGYVNLLNVFYYILYIIFSINIVYFIYNINYFKKVINQSYLYFKNNKIFLLIILSSILKNMLISLFQLPTGNDALQTWLPLSRNIIINNGIPKYELYTNQLLRSFPGYSLMLAWTYFPIMDIKIEGFRLIPLLQYITFILLCFKYCQLYLNKKQSLITTSIISILPYFDWFLFKMAYYPDLFLCLCIFSVYYYTIKYSSEKSKIQLVLLGMSIFLASITKYIGIVFIIPSILYLILFIKNFHIRHIILNFILFINLYLFNLFNFKSILIIPIIITFNVIYIKYNDYKKHKINNNYLDIKNVIYVMLPIIPLSLWYIKDHIWRMYFGLTIKDGSWLWSNDIIIKYIEQITIANPVEWWMPFSGFLLFPLTGGILLYYKIKGFYEIFKSYKLYIFEIINLLFLLMVFIGPISLVNSPRHLIYLIIPSYLLIGMLYNKSTLHKILFYGCILVLFVNSIHINNIIPSQLEFIKDSSIYHLSYVKFFKEYNVYFMLIGIFTILFFGSDYVALKTTYNIKIIMNNHSYMKYIILIMLIINMFIPIVSVVYSKNNNHIMYKEKDVFSNYYYGSSLYEEFMNRNKSGIITIGGYGLKYYFNVPVFSLRTNSDLRDLYFLHNEYNVTKTLLYLKNKNISYFIFPSPCNPYFYEYYLSIQNQMPIFNALGVNKIFNNINVVNNDPKSIWWNIYEINHTEYYGPYNMFLKGKRNMSVLNMDQILVKKNAVIGEGPILQLWFSDDEDNVSYNIIYNYSYAVINEEGEQITEWIETSYRDYVSSPERISIFPYDLIKLNISVPDIISRVNINLENVIIKDKNGIKEWKIISSKFQMYLSEGKWYLNQKSKGLQIIEIS